ncbi:hypothetical protein ABT052_17875 [Streptomyces sp. NPDC002766]|uniref:hypothetical protein n=1 Tax=Streptomyces sp. NPDC002766 TaxID=3154429 RepID=UPI0033199E49
MNNDFLKWAALAAALVATASAEYELARAVGFNGWVAAAVPGALDIYTVRAMRAHKDVLAAVVAMIGVNAASHLVTAGLLPVNVPLVVAVAAIAPLVLWRVHALRVDEGVGTADIPEPAEYVAEPEPEPVPAVPELVREIPAAVPDGARLLPIVARPAPAPKILTPAAEYTRTRAEVHAEYVPEPPKAMEYGWAAEHFKGQLLQGDLPSIRDIKNRLSVGQDKAKQIQAAFREALPQLAAQGVSA